MKKLLAFLLSMIMAMSLAVPAFADGPDGPQADTNLGVIGGEDGPTTIITTPGEDDILNSILNGNFVWWTADDEQELIDTLKEAMGGVPGQIGVMVNGQYIQFPDAAPEVTKGRTMVPVRALVETLGGEVDYQSGAVEFVLGGYIYEFAIGRTTVTVTPVQTSGSGAPQRDDIKMDCAPYIKNNRTYVPIRFISEALGYEVGWDSAFQTAVLVDKAALAAEIDKNFTILNKVQASRGLTLGEDESSLTDTQCSLKATLFDTLNGDKTYTAELSGATLMNAEAVNGSYSLTFSDNVLEALTELMVSSGAEAEDAALVGTVLASLKELEVIMTAEGKVFAHAPVLDEMSGQENVWAAMDLGPELAALFALQMDASSLTIGTVLAGTVDVNTVTSYAGVYEAVDLLAAMFGDSRFTTADGVSTLNFGLDDLEGLELTGAQEVKDAFKQYELTMVVDEQGGVTASCVMETAAQEGVPGVKMTMDAVQSAGKAEVTMTLHVANVCEVELTASAAESASTDAPSTQPPEGSVIIDTDTPAPLPE